MIPLRKPKKKRNCLVQRLRERKGKKKERDGAFFIRRDSSFLFLNPPSFVKVHCLLFPLGDGKVMPLSVGYLIILYWFLTYSRAENYDRHSQVIIHSKMKGNQKRFFISPFYCFTLWKHAVTCNERKSCTCSKSPINKISNERNAG